MVIVMKCPEDVKDVPRFVPQKPFPSYAYVPGYFPHPMRDPNGHSYGQSPPQVEPFNPRQWESNTEYLYGIDLFNFGYYWEAHEAWEALWHALGRTGPPAKFIQGLIYLAAAGVMIRRRHSRGPRIHAQNAADCFKHALDFNASEQCMGLKLEELFRIASCLTRYAQLNKVNPTKKVEIVFTFALFPKDGEDNDHGGLE